MVGSLIVEDCNFNGEAGSGAGQCSATISTEVSEDCTSSARVHCSDPEQVTTNSYSYASSSKVFDSASTSCSDLADCQQKCTDDEDCEGYTSKCSLTSKTTEETCGTCSVAGKTTEVTCGTCSGDASKTTAATCVSECEDSSYTTEATCGTCPADPSKTSDSTCVDTCYDYSSSSNVYKGATCTSMADCQQRCTDSLTCAGYTSACSLTDKTTQDTCGTCVGDTSKPTEVLCGSCVGDTSKTTEATCYGTCSNSAYSTQATCGTCNDPNELSIGDCVNTCYDYSTSNKVFKSDNTNGGTCSSVADCEDKCSNDLTCEGHTAACSLTDKTTQDTCGTCTTDTSKPTEVLCGTCVGDASKTTAATCVSECQDSSYSTEATCGTCDDPNELSVGDCVDTCFTYISSSKVFTSDNTNGGTCSSKADCEDKCSNDLTCEGWTAACSRTDKTTQDTCGTCPADPSKTSSTTCVNSCYQYSSSSNVYSGASCTDLANCEQECTGSLTCAGYTSACSDSSKTTEETCGTCDDTNEVSSTTCVDTCYEYSASTKIFSGNSCDNIDDCTDKCSDALSCVGFTGTCSDATKADTVEDCQSVCNVASILTEDDCIDVDKVSRRATWLW